MSSATQADVGQARRMLLEQGVSGEALDEASDKKGGSTAWMSPRQKWLNWLWSKYRCEEYEGCKVDWNGQEILEHTEHNFISQAGFLPAGFYDAGQSLPYKFRKPTAPVHFVYVIVKRFTGLLFSKRRSPKIKVAEDENTTAWLNAACTAARLWSHMVTARNYGGATGSVAIGFKFVRGKLQFEVHDPRFCTPDFADKSTGDLKSIEKRFMYRDATRNPLTGQWVEGDFWYRRVIDDQADTVWEKVAVDEGQEPDWDRLPNKSITHGFGECPVQWIQNKELQGETDGDPDCHGVFDLCWAIDALYSQGHTGTIKNADPQMFIASDADFASVQRGENAVQTEKGGNIGLMEMTGSGQKTAMDLAERLETRLELVARCKLDTNTARGGGAKTATEIEREYSSMLEEADVLREQFGERGIKPLLEKLLRAARKLSTGTVDKTDPDLPKIVKQTILLPKKPIVDDKTGETTGWADQQLGDGETVELDWPPYFTPTVTDAVQAVRAASDAKLGGLVDREHASSLVAPFFQVEDMPIMLQKIEQEENSQQEQAERAALAGMHQMDQRLGGGKPGGFGKPPGG